MYGMEIDHHRVLSVAMRGERKIDDRAMASFAVLSERLEQLRENPLFAGVSFSPNVLAVCGTGVAVG